MRVLSPNSILTARYRAHVSQSLRVRIVSPDASRSRIASTDCASISCEYSSTLTELPRHAASPLLVIGARRYHVIIGDQNKTSNRMSVARRNGTRIILTANEISACMVFSEYSRQDCTRRKPRLTQCLFLLLTLCLVGFLMHTTLFHHRVVVQQVSCLVAFGRHRIVFH